MHQRHHITTPTKHNSHELISSMAARVVLLPLLLILWCYSWTTSLASGNSVEALIQCLTRHTNASHHPVDSAIYTPKHASYSSVLEAYVKNLRFNTSTTRKPFLILTALHESHVQAAVVCAGKQNLQMKIRSGGHDFEGVSYTSNVPFFILDMFHLRSIDIDMTTETAWVQTGATLGELYYAIAEKSGTHGFPGGVCPTVGVGGHFSGGGYGNMMRKYGMSIDHIVDATMVDARGRLLNRKSMGEDLFWAIRGGGGASFGVVISYKITLVQVPKTVTVFRVDRTLKENATESVYKWQHVAPNVDPDLFIRLILQVVNSTGNVDQTIRARFVAFFLGNSTRLVSMMRESFPELGLSQSDCIETSWIKSVLFYADLDIDTPTDTLKSRTPQKALAFQKRKSDYVTRPIPKNDLQGIWNKMIELKIPMLTFNPYGGRMAEIPASATPFPHRAGNLWMVQYAASWSSPEESEHVIDSMRKLHCYMTPYVSENPRAAFLNYRDLDLGINQNGSYAQGEVHGVKYFKDNFARLVKIKSKVDAGNFFRNEQSIPLPITL